MLLLDEPTDNLDIESSEALELALDGFQGTVVAVSHDRTFLARFDRFVMITDDGEVYSLPDYETAMIALADPRTSPRAPRQTAHRCDAASIDDVRRVAGGLERAYEVVRRRVKFRVGRLVFLAFSRDETMMGFGFPKELRRPGRSRAAEVPPAQAGGHAVQLGGRALRDR